MTCEFMLREQAYHMFAGTTGVQPVECDYVRF
jgi:hypothetical protein